MRQLISPPFENIHLQLRPSKQIVYFQILFFGVLTYIISELSLPLYGKTTLFLITVAIFIADVRRNARLLSAGAIRTIHISNNKLTLTHADGNSEQATLMPYSLISPRLTILVVKYAKRHLPRPVYLTTDNCTTTDYRRLRALLTMRGKKLLQPPRSRPNPPLINR